VVTDSVSWLPAGWVYDSVLEDAATQVAPHGADLADRLRSATTSSSVAYLDIRPWADADVAAFADAVQDGLDRVVHRGRAAFADPGFFDGYVAKVAQLASMLRDEVARRRAARP